MKIYPLGYIALMSWILSSSVSAEENLTTLQLMERVIVPASNTLWQITEMPDDLEWKKMERAAQRTIEASKKNAQGGSGRDDKKWAETPAWQAYNEAMLIAAETALVAAQQKNIDVFYDAIDSLYPPCEGCHNVFNPSVIGQ